MIYNFASSYINLHFFIDFFTHLAGIHWLMDSSTDKIFQTIIVGFRKKLLKSLQQIKEQVYNYS